MRLVSLSVVAIVIVAGCGDDPALGVCRESFAPGDLVITEVFADYAAPAGGAGTDDGKEWFEIYNAGSRPMSLRGVRVVHSRPDGSRAKSHTIGEVTIAPGEYFTLGNATQDLVPEYVKYGYAASLGDLYNSGGGKLALKCGDNEIDSALYDNVKAGYSRQLTSLGPPDYIANDDPVNWCQAAGNEFESRNFGTPGAANDCAPVIAGLCDDGGTMREIVAPTPGQLVITEVMPNPAAVADAVGEWFEVKALADVDLNGLGLDRAGDSANPNIISSASCLRVAAGNYVVFGKSADATMNGNIPVPIAATFKFSMVSGSSTAPGDVRILDGTTEIDAITWTSSRSGKALQLDRDHTTAAGNDDRTNLCDATVPYGDGDLGTPGSENGTCSIGPPMGMCNDNGTLRPIVTPAPGELVITEVMPSPSKVSDSVGEWFEVKALADVDLNGLGLDRAGDSANPNVINAQACLRVAAGNYAVFAKSADVNTNGGISDVRATFTFSLIGGSMTTPGDVRVLAGTTVIDAITWTSSRNGKALQLDRDNIDAAVNDDSSYFCDAVQTYGLGDFGTPGTDNGLCSAPPPQGMCDDNGTMRPIVSPAVGDVVITEVMARPSAVSATAGQWFEVKALVDVDLNGVGLDRANDTANPIILSSASCIHLAAGSYGLFARSADSTMNGGLSVLGTFSFSLNPTTTTPDVQLVLGTTVIDAVTWTSSTSGRSRSLNPAYTTDTANDDDANWCNSQTVYNGTDHGTPGMANEACGPVVAPGQCLDDGTARAIVKPPAGALVITEFLANPAGTETGVDAAEEWFEIINAGTTAFDLNDLSLQGSSTTTNKIQTSACKSIEPGAYALFAHTTDPAINGDLPDVDATFTFALGNASGKIRVLDDTTLLDEIVWTTSASAPDGRSRQLMPDKTNTTDNDVVANFCSAPVVAAQLYGTSANYGTPKAVNACQ